MNQLTTTNIYSRCSSKSKVFKLAHYLFNKTNKSFSKCLKKAWSVYRLIKKMITHNATAFAYQTVKGELRHATGIMYGFCVDQYASITYFDTDKQQYRKFKPENLITNIKIN